MKSLMYLILILGGVTFMGCPNGGNQGPNSACTEEDNLAMEETCFAATAIVQGNPFPNPVTSGGTVSLNMKIGAVDSNFTPIPAAISNRVYSSVTGQFISQQNVGTVAPSSSFQNVPIWTNVNVATGIYILEVTIDLGVCGTKTICLDGEQRIDVIK